MSSPPVSVCALVPYLPDTAPSQRFRIEQWLPYLPDHGVSVELLPFADARLAGLLHRPGRWAGKVVATGAAFLRRFHHCLRASRHGYRILGHTIGAGLVRGADRSERVAEAMRCRGFDGRFHTLTEFHSRPSDVVFFLLAFICFAGLVLWDRL